MEGRSFSAGEVQAWLDDVQSDLRSIEEKVAPLLEEQRRLEEREDLLRDLLRSFQTAAASNGNGRDGDSVPPPITGSVGQYVIERAVEILRDAGEPMHINDLHARFLEHGYTVPGAGAPANLIVHIRKAPEIASPQRGIYGLSELLGPIKPRRTRKRTTTRRRRKK